MIGGATEETARSSGDLATFSMFDGNHLGVLVVTVVIAVALCRWARPRTEGDDAVRRVAIVLALVQLANQVIWHSRMILNDAWTLQESLPLHLCDAAVMVTVLALWRPRPWLFELCYFWSLVGALQALITPDIEDGPGSYFFWQFFITHSGLVIAGTYLAFGEGLTPRRGCVWRVWIATNLWALLAATANVAFDANYMFLSEPPPTGSLLDAFGEWPWYILVCEFLAVGMIALLSLPFRSRRAASPEPGTPVR